MEGNCVPNDADEAGLQDLCMLASAVAGRTVAVAAAEAGEPPWTNGHTIFVDPAGLGCTLTEAIVVQACLISAGSLRPDIVRAMIRRPELARRYLGIEGHRALSANADLLPGALRSLVDAGVAARAASPEEALAAASGKAAIDDPAIAFGTIHAKSVLAAAARTEAKQADHGASEHVPRRTRQQELDELDDGHDEEGADHPDLFSSPVGGGGFIGKWLKKMLSSARQAGSGGPPGADSPTHRTNSSNRGAYAVSSSASPPAEETGDPVQEGTKYPEWDVNRQHYRADWCTVREAEAEADSTASASIYDAIGVRRPLARLGMGLHRRHRQIQGDDIDIDAAIEARVELRAGSVPDEAVYLDSLRRRRDLSVLILLDVSGSTAEAGTLGQSVHQQQQEVVAALTVALHDLGDRISLYAYFSQGRSAVTMLPIKRFDEGLDARVIKRLNSLRPGGYSRLGAAIRHGSAVLEARGGTSRRLLVVISDGLAYDHGYERSYGAADARRALTEARRRGTGCVCLTVGASTDVDSLRRVFGTTAHATIGTPDRLIAVIGPLFRSALRSAEVRRKVS
jgi:nitric oxide reductase NorD protein